ncbi:MAG: restriction endonuclease PLD domain-containing protein [Candidatus Puniceispirillaceae bacterium]
MLHSNLNIGEVDKVLSKLLSKSNKVTIASGYFGLSQIQKYRSKFIDIVKNDGQVTLIHGLGKFESIPEILERELESLQEDIRKFCKDDKSGVFFATERRYHGKIYRIQSGSTVSALIGSSNFSKQGNINNLEANILTMDSAIICQADHLIAQLLKFSQEYSPGILPERKARTASVGKANNFKIPAGMAAVSKDVISKKVDFTLPVRVLEKSSFNLAFGKGRLMRPASGKPFYIPRPFYEVEITLPAKFWKPPLTNFVPNTKSKPVNFNAYTDNGMYFDCNFNRKHSGKNDTRPLHTIGGDFQSTPREALGMFVKDKLIASGAMNFGEQITEDTLAYYGRNEIMVRMINNKTLHLEF